MGEDQGVEYRMRPSTSAFTVVGQPVDSVENFTYLESDMDSSGRSAPDMLRRISLTSATMGRLARVFKNKRLSLSTKYVFTIAASCLFRVGGLDAPQGRWEKVAGVPYAVSASHPWYSMVILSH